MKPSSRQVLLFADRLPPLIGGVETHAGYFIEHFKNHASFPLSGIVTKDEHGKDVLYGQLSLGIDLAGLPKKFHPSFLFFNSGRWIEELESLRRLFPQSVFLYRTGGNEILKASLSKATIPVHQHRQQFWADRLNNTIDCLITNSAFTEKRLKELGINCPFLRCVGGVFSEALHSDTESVEGVPILFSAARFVPYKNHALLLDVISNLKRRGHRLRLRLAGDGPLFQAMQDKSAQLGLSDVVEFLGALDNHSVCREISKASIYIQLSSDYLTQVPGGSYMHSEGMGRSILEAITAGTYVIAGMSGALSEIVTSERGTLFRLDDFDQLVGAMDRLLANPPKKGKPTSIYDWSKLFQKYEEFMGCCR